METLTFQLPPAPGHDSEHLRALLEIHDELVRLRAARRFFVHLTALLSGLSWLLGMLVPAAQVTEVSLGLWGAAVLVSLSVGACELGCYRRRARALARLATPAEAR